MDMKIDAQKINTYRKSRAWSQQQLADIADLSLRTVQRIERTGQASYESIQSIAAAFDSKVEEFNCVDVTPKLPHRPSRLQTFALAIVAAAVSWLYMSWASAEPLMLKVSVDKNQQQLASVQLLNDSGRDSELRIDGVVKLVFTPVVEANQQVRIVTAIYRDKKTDYELISTPTVITQHGEIATIRFDDAGNTFELQMTPLL